ncbi:sigma factor [Breznakiella homolactica]|uniref:RNA polymerase sigma-70 region 2 domain-containing protein n=1 Tax=Breznakiella homolactica TaxID=2798577 RepID=A0A7T7XKA2_9SPIR|nr:sigma factor [Breznakiella homolactica]QQO07808.1 hypothetical protein JFL75_12755 [Breznakiella homolactica]
MNTELTAQVQLARTDKGALNALIRSYMPFIKKSVSGVFFKSQDRQDNLTEAMLAFCKSVETYNPENGAFIPYAGVVIRNRLLNRALKENSLQKKQFSLSVRDDEKELTWEADVSRQIYDRAAEERNLRLEIETISAEFGEWGFTWASLLKNCPKQARSRGTCQRIAGRILDDQPLCAEILRTRQLPIKRLSEEGRFSRKVLEKYRQYILALIIISRGEYPYVYSFVPQSFEEVD